MHVSGRAPGLILVAGTLALPAGLAAAQPAAAPVRVRAVAFDFAPIAPLTRDVMRRELGRALAPAAVSLSWRTAPEGGETDPDELRVVLLPRAGVGPDRDALGSTANQGPVRTIWIFVPSVAVTLGLQPEAVAGSFDAQRRMGIGLGRVLAHEVVHALAPGIEHAGAGLMRPRLHAFQLVRSRPALDGGSAASLAAGARAWLARGARRGAAAPAPDEPAAAAIASGGTPDERR